MEQLKVKKKDTLILNVVIYLGLCFFFLYIQHAYRHHISPFSFVYLKKGLELFWYVALVLVSSSVLIWKHHRYAIWAYQFSIFLVGFKVIEGLFLEFNKVIVIAMFFYAIISYFLYQLLKYYLELAFVNANYGPSDLFGPLLKSLPCKLSTNGIEVEGVLSNWDEEGCFIKLSRAVDLSSPISLSIHFSGRDFTQDGEVVAVARDLTGVGIKFEKKAKGLSVFNWSEFMELIHELGYQPERLR